jgi:hypothetical protein
MGVSLVMAFQRRACGIVVASTVEPGLAATVRVRRGPALLEGYSAWGVSERHRVLLLLASFALQV